MALLFLAGVATALPVGDSEPEARELPPSKRQAPYGPPPPVYKPAPAPYKPAPPPYKAPHPEAKLPPQPYQFEYGVADQYTGTNFQAVENQDEKGTVIGKWISISCFDSCQI